MSNCSTTSRGDFIAGDFIRIRKIPEQNKWLMYILTYLSWVIMHANFTSFTYSEGILAFCKFVITDMDRSKDATRGMLSFSKYTWPATILYSLNSYHTMQ